MGRELSVKGVNELNLFSGTPTSSDMIPILDHSSDEVKRIEATKVAFAGGPAFSGVPAAGDDFYIFDDSASQIKELDATKIPVQGAAAFSGVPASNDTIPIYDNSGTAWTELDATKVPVQGATAFSGVPASSDTLSIWDNSASAFRDLDAQKVFVQGATAFSGVPASNDVIPIYDNSGTAFASLDATKVPVQGASAFSGAPATADEFLIYDASASAFATVGAQDIPINQAFGTDIFANANIKHHVVTATLAEINAGHVLLTGVSGKTIYVFNVIASVSGNFATGTDVRLQDEQGSPVEVLRLETAALTDQAILRAGDNNTLIQIGMVTGITAGDDLLVEKTGSAFTGGTSITFSILYSIQ